MVDVLINNVKLAGGSNNPALPQTRHICGWRNKIGDLRSVNTGDREGCEQCDKDDIYFHWESGSPNAKWHYNDANCGCATGENICGGETVKYSSTGYTVRADVHFPEDVKPYLEAYPPLFINKLISKDVLSKRQVADFEDCGGVFAENYKLCPTLEDASDVVMDSNMLCLLALLGAEVKVNRAIKYFSSDYMRSWVELCTKLRIQASKNGDVLGVNLFKLILNR